ncbi:MAG TPA: hypothetical protein VF659_15370 [Pyrinomonadaceae bacterium]
MGARTTPVPRVFYALALGVGLFGLPFVLALASHVVTYALADYLRGLPPGSYDGEIIAGAVIAAFHALLGGAFGAVWPEVGWRWGVWLTALPICLASFVAPDAATFLAWAALTLLPACGAAQAAARLHLSYVEAG